MDEVLTESALVFSCDENIAHGLAVAMHSAIAKLHPEFAPEIYVLDNGLSESSRARLLRVANAARRSSELRFIRVPSERLGHLPGPSIYGPAAYSRLLIPELVPTHIQRAVYLDPDVLVLRDLSPLLTIELGEAPFGAVWSFRHDNAEPKSSGLRESTRFRPEFNAGVLVMDLARWRSAGLTNRALEFAASRSKPLPFADQDALNAVAESWHELDYRWNVQATVFFPPNTSESQLFARLYRQRRDLYRTAAILHFVGTSPWNHWCTTPGAMAWVRAMIRTGWYSRSEEVIWLLHWLGKRTGFYLRTTSRRFG